jgi:hypothetical protein
LYEEAIPLAMSWKLWNWSSLGIDLNPHFFHYPALTIYLNFAIQALHFGTGSLFGIYPSLAAFQQAYSTDLTVFVVLSRLLSVGFDLGTVIILYKLGSEILDQSAGIVAAGMAALSPILVAQSHLINVDSPLTFFCALSLLFINRIVDDPKRPSYLLAGIGIGLAASSKYNGALLIPVLVLAHIMANQKNSGRSAGAQFSDLLLAVVLSGVVFMACNPFILLDFKEFYADFSFEEMHMGAGHLGMDPSVSTWGFYFMDALPGNLGWGLLAAAAAMFGWSLYARKKVWIIASFPLLYLVVISTWNMRAERYLLPAVPPTLLLAAVGTVTLATAVAARRRAPGIWPLSGIVNNEMLVTAFLAILLLAQPAAATVAYLKSFSRPDTRMLAKEWISTHTSPGSVVASIPFGLVLSDSTRRVFPIPFLAVNAERVAPFYDTRWYLDCDLVIGTSFDYDRYARDPQRYGDFLAYYDSLRTHWKLVAQFEPEANQSGPAIWLFSPPPQLGDRPLPDDVMQRLAAAPESSRVSNFLQGVTFNAIEKGRIAKAEQLLREILSVETGNLIARETLVRILLSQTRLDDAAIAADEYLQLNPQSAFMQWAKGDILMRKGQYGEAESVLEKAVAIDADMGAAYDDLLSIHVRARNKEKALSVLVRHYAILPPESDQAKRILADIKTLRNMK